MWLLCGVIRDGCGLGERVVREGDGLWRGERTRWGGRRHDLLGTRCDPYGMSNHYSCSLSHHLGIWILPVSLCVGLGEKKRESIVEGQRLNAF